MIHDESTVQGIMSFSLLSKEKFALKRILCTDYSTNRFQVNRFVMEHGRIDEGSAHENLSSPLEMSSTASVGKIQQIIKQPCLHQLAASCATANQNRTQQELPHLYEEW